MYYIAICYTTLLTQGFYGWDPTPPFWKFQNIELLTVPFKTWVFETLSLREFSKLWVLICKGLGVDTIL